MNMYPPFFLTGFPQASPPSPCYALRLPVTRDASSRQWQLGLLDCSREVVPATVPAAGPVDCCH